MTTLAKLIQHSMQSIQQWLFDPVPAYGLVICRVGLGSCLFLAYLSRWSLVDTLYGPDGYAGNSYYQRFPESGQVGFTQAQYQLYDQLQHVSSSAVIFSLYVALLLSSLCFALGIRSKLSGTIALVLHSLFLGRNLASTWGWATMIRPFLLYLILASTRHHWSALGWIRARLGMAVTPVEWTCSAWPLRLVQVHITCVFLALWERIDRASWVSGQMLFEALNSRDWGRIDFDWWPYLDYLAPASQAALCLELGAVVALWIRPIGKYWAVALMGLFAILVATTSVGWWDMMMISLLSVFLPASWLQRAASKLVGGDALDTPAS